MTTLAVFSDLHIEHSSISLDASGADAVVLAGDIYALGQAYANRPSVIHWIDQMFPNQEVVFVPGNHDFEDSVWERQMEAWGQHVEQTGQHIHLLWDRCVDVCGVRFVGTPLFSNFASTGEPEVVKQQAKSVADFRRIFHTSGHPVTPEDYVHWHEQSKLFIAKELKKDKAIPKIVVTHFAPSLQMRNPNRSAQLLDAYWLNNCEDLLDQADTWISGHTHFCCDLNIGTARVVSNARGTSKLFGLSSDPLFNPSHRIKVGASPTAKNRM